jgi:hypothetical protein
MALLRGRPLPCSFQAKWHGKCSTGGHSALTCVGKTGRGGHEDEFSYSLEEPAMKVAILIAMAFVSLSSLPIPAHQTNVQAQRGAAAAIACARPSESAPSPAGEPALRPVNAQLVGELDSKSAKTGETILAQTKESVKTANGTVLPKGSRLIGHVTGIEAPDAEHANSTLTIRFDRAELKNGESLALHSLSESVSVRGGD